MGKIDLKNYIESINWKINTQEYSIFSEDRVYLLCYHSSQYYAIVTELLEKTCVIFLIFYTFYSLSLAYGLDHSFILTKCAC